MHFNEQPVRAVKPKYIRRTSVECRWINRGKDWHPCGEDWGLDRAGGSVQSGIFLKADSGPGILQRIIVNDEKDRSVRNDLLIFSGFFRLRKEPEKSPGSCFRGISVKEKPEDLLTKIYVPGKVENPKSAMLTLHDFRSNIKSVAEAFSLND